MCLQKLYPMYLLQSSPVLRNKGCCFSKVMEDFQMSSDFWIIPRTLENQVQDLFKREPAAVSLFSRSCKQSVHKWKASGRKHWEVF